MKKYISFIVLMCFALTGCSMEIPMKEQTAKPRQEWGVKEEKFELDQKYIALLYNAGMPKALLKADSDVYFTVILPKFYEGTYSEDKHPTKTGCHFTIKPPGTYYNDKGVLEKEYVITTLDYVKLEDSADFDSNIYRAKLRELVLSEDDYNAKKFESYDDYVSQYNAALDALFPVTGEQGTTMSLTGYLEPVKGTYLVNKIKFGEDLYDLPFRAYRFELPSGDYLYMRVTLVSPKALELFDENAFAEKFLQVTKEYRQKDANRIIDYLQSIETDFDSVAKEISEGILCGDFSSYYKATKSSTVVPTPSPESDASFDEDAEGDDSEEDEKSVDSKKDEEAVESFGSEVDIKQQEYKELLEKSDKINNPTKSDKVIDGFDDEDTYGGYNDYDTSGGGYFEQ